MTLFEGLVGGGLGGLSGAAVAHLGVVLLIRLRWAAPGDTLPAALSLGVTLGLTAFGLSRRPRPLLVGLLGGSLAALGVGKPAVWLAAYAAALWGTIAALGWLLGGKRGAVALPAGALAGFLATKALPLQPGFQNPLLPSAADLLTTTLTGAGMGAGLYLASRRNDEKARAA